MTDFFVVMKSLICVFSSLVKNGDFHSISMTLLDFNEFSVNTLEVRCWVLKIKVDARMLFQLVLEFHRSQTSCFMHGIDHVVLINISSSACVESLLSSFAVACFFFIKTISWTFSNDFVFAWCLSFSLIKYLTRLST